MRRWRCQFWQFLIEFGRFAEVAGKRRAEGKPEPFDFLGSKDQFQFTPRSRGAFRKLAQFNFRHNKFRSATIQTDSKLWKYLHDGLVKVSQAWQTHAYLPNKLALMD